MLRSLTLPVPYRRVSQCCLVRFSSILEDNLVFNPSPSVNSAMGFVGTKEKVGAAAFAQAIFKLHGEYAGRRAASLQLRDTPSTRMVQEWVDETRTLFDPANEIKRRFNGLIEKLQPARVVIMIDDLDRCQSSYVVELLEGVQTLFREAPVVFVVAADRQWLNACYEDVYEKLKPRVQEPGKPLGALFLEKAFRFSTPMPGIPEKLKEHYRQYLLRVSTDQLVKDLAVARAKAENELAKAQTESEVRDHIETSGDLSFPEQLALREEAAVRLAAPDIIERIEHTLKPYGRLLDTNPRAMKLLVNGYSANRALSILSEVDIDLHQLALWTILSSRWPRLADYLAEHPDMLERIGQEGIEDLPEDLMALWNDQGVKKVVQGYPTHIALKTDTLRQCVRLRS